MRSECAIRVMPLRARDADDVCARLEILRQALRERGGRIVEIRWSCVDAGRTAHVCYEIPADAALPTHAELGA